MNNTFSFSRFGRFFKYDFKRWTSSYGLTLMLMSLAPVILYVITLCYSLIFSQEWGTPGLTLRVSVFCFVAVVLFITYPKNVYGYITEKRAGSMLLMIPASTLEKFLSMMLNTLIIVPAIFVGIYLAADGLICLCDSSCGGTLAASFTDALTRIASFAYTTDSPIRVSMFSIYMQFAFAILFFLLGALLFKKHKILYPILIFIGFNMVMSMLFGLLFTTGLIDMDTLMKWSQLFAGKYLTDPDFISWAVPFANVAATLWDILVVSALACAVFFRLKTIKH
jgi:hypothetical protein